MTESLQAFLQLTRKKYILGGSALSQIFTHQVGISSSSNPHDKLWDRPHWPSPLRTQATHLPKRTWCAPPPPPSPSPPPPPPPPPVHLLLLPMLSLLLLSLPLLLRLLLLLLLYKAATVSPLVYFLSCNSRGWIQYSFSKFSFEVMPKNGMGKNCIANS